MASALSDKILANLGSVDALFATLDITSYAAGGESVSAATLGIPREPKKIVVLSSEKNLIYRWDKTNKKLLALYPTATHAHDLTLKNAAVADAAGTRVNAGTNLLGANTGGDLTVAGAGANGGVQNKTAVAGTELSATDDGGTVELIVLY